MPLKLNTTQYKESSCKFRLPHSDRITIASALTLTLGLKALLVGRGSKCPMSSRRFAIRGHFRYGFTKPGLMPTSNKGPV